MKGACDFTDDAPFLANTSAGIINATNCCFCYKWTLARLCDVVTLRRGGLMAVHWVTSILNLWRVARVLYVTPKLYLAVRSLHTHPTTASFNRFRPIALALWCWILDEIDYSELLVYRSIIKINFDACGTTTTTSAGLCETTRLQETSAASCRQVDSRLCRCRLWEWKWHQQATSYSIV